MIETGTDDEEYNDNNGNQREPCSSRPSNWFFNGWFALLLFGPFAEKGDRLPIMEIGASSNGDDKNKNRAAVRKNNAIEKDVARAYGVDDDGVVVERGITSSIAMSQQISIANLAFKKDQQNQIQKNNNVMGINLQMKHIEATIDRLEKRANARGIEESDDNILWKQIHDHEFKLKELQLKLEQANEQKADEIKNQSNILIGELIESHSTTLRPTKKLKSCLSDNSLPNNVYTDLDPMNTLPSAITDRSGSGLFSTEVIDEDDEEFKTKHIKEL